MKTSSSTRPGPSASRPGKRREIDADDARENPILGEEGGLGPGSMSAP